MKDLRDWLEKVDRRGELRTVEGADWHLEIGCVTELNIPRKNGPALLFDKIPGYPAGFRVLTCSTTTPGRLALSMDLPPTDSDLELLQALQEKLPVWDAGREKFPPEVVAAGPILENVLSGEEVDLFKFPVPQWHAGDGGRYIGTGDAVITQDPDTGEVNLGAYRMEVHDQKTCGLKIIPAQHGRFHYEKYHARGKRCPIAVSLGHHPLVFRMACRELPPGSEYQYLGAISGQAVQVIKEEITGLPIPAASEIVIAGWCPPDKTRAEGPFGEFTGYYAASPGPAPIVEVERIYYRNDPILLGSPPGRIGDSGYYQVLTGSAMLYSEFMKSHIPGIKGVWLHEVGKQMFIAVSLKQMYPGHVKEAALFVSQSRVGANLGRYVVIVDEDIDPTNVQDVIWALCTRSDPEKDIDIIRRARGNPLDPIARKPAKEYFNSRALIDACRPYEWRDEFPRAIQPSPDLINKVKQKWGYVLDF